jgi:hypothetical protein
MKQSEIAEYFNVSLTTLQNWKRQGAPISGDLSQIVEWKVRRELKAQGLADILPGLPGFEGELVRRLEHLNKAIDWTNALKPDVKIERGLFKVSMCLGLSLERELLALPRRILAEAKATTLPEDVYRIVFAAIDHAKGNDQEEGEPINPSRIRDTKGASKCPH